MIPVIEDDPAPYDSKKSKLFVKAFQEREGGLYADNNVMPYHIGDSVRGGNYEMSLGTDGAKYVIESDDFLTTRLNRYRIIRRISDD